MNIEKERELFEDAYCKVQMIVRGGDTFNTYPNGDYVRQSLHLAWLMWLASRNCEGYVFVPVEPTEKIKDAICGWECNTDVEITGCYKAMIGACNDH